MKKAYPSLADRLKTAPVAQPPAASAAPAGGMAKQSPIKGKSSPLKAKQSKTASANLVPGVNQPITGASSAKTFGSVQEKKAGRPMAKSEVLELLEKAGYKMNFNGASSSSTMAKPPSAPKVPKPTAPKTPAQPHEQTDKESAQIKKERKVASGTEVTKKDSEKVKTARQTASKEATAKESEGKQNARARASGKETTKVSGPPKIAKPQANVTAAHAESSKAEGPFGVKHAYKKPSQFSLPHFLAGVAYPGSPVVSKIKSAVASSMFKSEVMGHVKGHLDSIASRRKPKEKTMIQTVVDMGGDCSEIHNLINKQGLKKSEDATKVLPKHVDPEAHTQTNYAPIKTKATVAARNPSSASKQRDSKLNADYHKELSDKQDPAKKAKFKSVFKETQLSVAHKNKHSPEPDIKKLGEHQWKDFTAKDKLHFHLKNAAAKVKRTLENN